MNLNETVMRQRCLNLIDNTIHFCLDLKEEYPNSKIIDTLLILRVSNIYSMGHVSQHEIVKKLKEDWYKVDTILVEHMLRRVMRDTLLVLPSENLEILESDPDVFIDINYNIVTINMSKSKILEWPELRNGNYIGVSAN